MTTYSHSRLSTFETCPRQFWYHYIGKPEVEPVEGIEAFLGSRVHEAFQELYRRRIGGRLMSCDELLAWFNAAWDRRWSGSVRIVNKRFTAADYRQVGLESLRTYYARHAPFNQAHTLRLEGKVAVDLLNDGRYRLQGVIDRLDQRPDGGYEIHDYKTAGSVPTQAEADEDRQLALYQIAVKQMWPDATDVELVWHYVRFDKELRSRRTTQQLDAVRDKCISLIDGIESRGKNEDGFPTAPSYLCDWCAFRTICPATSHRAAVEVLPPDEFKADTGVRLVDLLADLRAKKQALNEQIYELDGQMDSVKETLIRFARQQGVTSVCGSSHEASIAAHPKVVLPEAGTPEREALEAKLRELGLYDEVASVNWQRLNSLWQSGQLPESVAIALQPHLGVESGVRVSVKKLPGQDGSTQ